MSQSLEQFFRDVFLVEWLQSCNRSILERYIRAVDWFLLFTRGEPTLGDVTNENLNRFIQWLIDSRRARAKYGKQRRVIGNQPTARNYASRVRQIARYAMLKNANCRRDMRLIDFFQKVYVEDRKLRSETVNSYRLAIRSFSRSWGSDIMLAELSPAAFEAWIAAAAVKQKRAELVKAVWRFAYLLGYVATTPDDDEPQKLPAPIVTNGDSLRLLMTSKYFPLNARIRTEQTKKQYKFALNNFAEFLGHEPTLADLIDDNVAGTMTMLATKQLSPQTINDRRGRINALWSWLAKRGMVSTFPTTQRVPEPARTPIAWLKEELAILFSAFDSERILINGIPAPAWWKSLHHVFWDTGERVSALMQCEWSHLHGAWLLVPAEIRKGQKKDMSYQLSEDTLASLEAVRQPERKLIWPWPYSPDYLWTRYKIIRRRAGLPTDRRSSFHRMRRSVASHFEAAGGNATQLLAHESRRTTQGYLDPRIVKPPQAINLLFNPIGGAEKPPLQ